MRHSLVLAGALLASASLLPAQGTLQAISIGSGAGSLDLDLAYTTGHVDGDSGTFDPGGGVAAGTTIWNIGFLFYDGTTDVWADNGFLGHANQIADGTVSSTASSITNTGMTFPGITGLTGNLQMELTQPIPNTQNIVTCTWSWTLINANPAELPLNVTWFVDMDSYVDTNDFVDDVVAFKNSLSNYTFGNSLGGVVMGNTSGSGVDLNTGVVMDVVGAGITDMRGISYTDGSAGSSFFWSDSDSYAGQGPESTGFILGGDFVMDNDGNADFLSDDGRDAGGAIQTDVVVPANGQLVFQHVMTWGIDEVATAGFVLPTSVEDWTLF